MRDHRQAGIYFKQLLSLQRTLYPTQTFPKGHDRLVATLSHLGTTEQAVGDLSAALADCEEAFAMHARLHAEHESTESHAARAQLLSNLESVLSATAHKGDVKHRRLIQCMRSFTSTVAYGALHLLGRLLRLKNGK
jgi:hypothetical protein